MNNIILIPPGYKSSPLGPIPSDWDTEILGTLAVKIGDGLHSTPIYDEFGEYLFINGNNIYDGFIKADSLTRRVGISEFEKYKKELGRNTILLSINGTIGSLAFYNGEKIILGKSACYINVGSKISIKFLYYTLQSDKIGKYFDSELTGSTIKNLGITSIRNTLIPLPSLQEQFNIANLLATWDEAISKVSNLIELHENRKKGLVQELLTGRRRLNGYDSEVDSHPVGKYLKEISERYSDTKGMKVLSVTNSRGFIDQKDQFDRSVASEDTSNYKIVRKGQFAYNPSRVNVGSLDLLKNFESGILSPMYVVFEVDKTFLIPKFFFYQLKSHWFTGHIPMYVQGSVRDSLSFDGLCGMKFFIPSLEEQSSIVDILEKSDQEIQLLKSKLEKLKEQKKGLMQQLLTGKKRLKF